MDDHAHRVCAPLGTAWADFEAGQATLLDLARIAEQAAKALDNASAPLPAMLAAAASELELTYYASERDDHLAAGRRILGPALSRIDF